MDFQTSLSSRPCLDPRWLFNLKKSKTFYPLQRFPEQGCGAAGEMASAQLVDSCDQLRHYADNKVDLIVSQIPYYADYVKSEDLVNLYAVKALIIPESGNQELREVRGRRHRAARTSETAATQTWMRMNPSRSGPQR